MSETGTPVEEATKQLKENGDKLNDALGKLEGQKKLLLEKLAPEYAKDTQINGETAKVMITKGGVVMIQFVSKEEALKYYGKL